MSSAKKSLNGQLFYFENVAHEILNIQLESLSWTDSAHFDGLEIETLPTCNNYYNLFLVRICFRQIITTNLNSRQLPRHVLHMLAIPSHMRPNIVVDVSAYKTYALC